MRRSLAGTSEPRWPDFRPLALAAGIRAWLSAPLRQRHGPIGALDFARTDPQPWQPQDLAAANGFARLIGATLQQASARQQQVLSPALRYAVEHDARIEQARGVIMQRERLDEVAASSCCASRPRSRTNPSEPSPNASSPAPDVDLHLPNSAPHCVAVTGIGPRDGGADAPMISRAKRIAQRGRTLHKSAPPGRCREGSRCAAAANAVVGSPLDRATLAGGSKKPIATCYWGSIAQGVVGEEHGMPMPNGHGHQIPGPVKVRGPRSRRQASAHRRTAWATASA
jgi:hypothetical protein